MKIGYARVSKSDGSQVIDLQVDALTAAGVDPDNVYRDYASGKKDKRPGLESCIKAIRAGDTLMVWKLDRLGRDLKHLVALVEELAAKDAGFKVLSGYGANIDTTTPEGKFAFGIFAALGEYERELIRERTKAGLASARARGRIGGRSFQLTKNQVRYAQSAMKNSDTVVSTLCKELGVSRQTLYRYVGPNGELRSYGEQVLNS